MGGRTEWEPVLVVYPDKGNVFYETLARRLATAASSAIGLGGGDDQIRLEAASSVQDVDPVWLKSATALVVNPAECSLSGSRDLARLERARRRIAVLADHVHTDWFAAQFETHLEIDAVIDVGFVPQEHEQPSGLPYIFLYNAALQGEAEQIRAQSPGPRPLPWAVVGHSTPERAALAKDLVDHLGAEGIVFLPSLRPVRAGGGMLSPAALGRVLSTSSLYVWCAHHRWAYYESFRFLEAMLAGAVPCKVESRHLDALAGLPNVYSSVAELAEHVRERGAGAMFEDARSYYLGQGNLGDHLGRALSRV